MLTLVRRLRLKLKVIDLIVQKVESCTSYSPPTDVISKKFVINDLKMYESNQSNPNETFCFADYDCIGFDLDNTICRYKISNMVALEYDTLANYLVDNRGYSGEHLLKPIEENLDFMVKGLILDTINGNVLRIDPNGRILHGSHGTKEMTRSEIINYYGQDSRWKVTDIFSRDPLHTWNGPYSEQMRTLLDYFDMPAGLVFARAVDTLDEKNDGKLDVYTIWPDILAALQDMFQKEHFQLEKGGYFPKMKAMPENYIHKCSDSLITWFHELKKQKKLLFLVTGSNVDFATHTAQNSMGPNWKELFDIIIFFAKKPGFFTTDRPFTGLQGFEETEHVKIEDLKLGGEYTCGNWKGLLEFFKKHTKKENLKVVYIGDNLIQDVYTPAVHTECDAIAICEELQAEGVFGHEPDHDDRHFLVSNQWGSYFHHDEQDKATFWKEFIKKHSKMCIPSLEYAAKFPIDHTFPTH